MRWLALALLTASAGCAGGGAPRYLILATTTSVGNSGLLDTLAPAWREATGVELRPTLVGSGRALRMLQDGQADVVISHAPETEAAMLAPQRPWLYRKFMFNDFVVVGPSADPAHASGEESLEGALRRIVSSHARFVSRGDQSGTHEREQRLWSIAGAAPSGDALLTSGAGMAVTLRQASDQGAYTLTDRATFEQLRAALQLTIVFQRDPRLLNTYAVIVDRGLPRSGDALRFADWLVEGHGRELIAAYRIAGSTIQPFEVWPAGAPADRPDALPR